MEKQTKKQAIKEAVKKCTYKKECQKQELTKKEKEYIINTIKINLDSYLENKKEIVKFSIQHMEKIPEEVWRKGKIDNGEYGINVSISLLEKLYKKLIRELEE